MTELAKRCTKCGEAKPLPSFAKNGSIGLHTSCKACQNKAHREKRLANPAAAKAIDKARHERDRERRLLTMRKYSANNAEKRCALERNRYENNADAIKARNYAYRADNRSLVYAWNNARRAAEKRATPAWADFAAMAKIYEQAARMSVELGCAVHVDHIVPLRGKMVCGLHVQTNLAPILAADNLRKGAKHG